MDNKEESSNIKSKFKCAYTDIVPLHKLVPNPLNPNKHPEKQIKLLAQVISFQGQRSPVVVSKRSGFIVKGHGRLAAIKTLGWGECAVDYQDYNSEAEEYADLVADNAIAELSATDEKVLIEGIKKLPGDFNLKMLGLPDLKMNKLVATMRKPPIGEDEVPEVEQKKVIVKTGDLWLLGKHRLLCGNSTLPEDIQKLMNGQKADGLVWDPPWNVEFEYNSYQDNKTADEYGKFLNDCISNFLSVAKDNYCAFVWQSEKNWKFFNDWFGKYNPRIAVVAKNFVQAAKCFINRAWDPVFCWHGEKYEAKNSIEFRDYFLSNTANTKQTEDRVISGQHPCPRNVDAVEYFLKWFDSGAVIMDCCLGSGTTLVACEKNNKQCVGCEIDPFYVTVIIERYMKFTGRDDVILESNGKKYSELINE